MASTDRIHLTALNVRCIIGIFAWERRRKQTVVIDVSFPCDAARAARTDRVEDALDYKRVAKTALGFVGSSRYHLVETLAEALAERLLGLGLSEVTVRVSKPGALRHTKDVSLTVTRRIALPTATFSLGSNIRPEANLMAALRAFRGRFGRVQTSSVYETSPVGTTQGSPFLNLVVRTETPERPASLRTWARALERKQGRLRVKDRNASRTLDVDLIDWTDPKGQRPTSTPALPLPHPDIALKAFVLFPLLEIDPGWVHPASGCTLVELAAAFPDRLQRIRRRDLAL